MIKNREVKIPYRIRIIILYIDVIYVYNNLNVPFIRKKFNWCDENK